jgi:hypothetical protein
MITPLQADRGGFRRGRTDCWFSGGCFGCSSLLTELVSAKHQCRELEQKVRVSERRLGAQGPSIGPSLLDQHPVVVELRGSARRDRTRHGEKDRTIASLQDDVEVLRKTNRSLVRECGLNSSERLPFN